MCSKCNNKYLKSRIKTLYLNTNNLYGYAMCKFLPTIVFKWIAPKKFDSDKYSSNSLSGCVLHADIEYLKELRKLHNGSPLAYDRNQENVARLSVKNC